MPSKILSPDELLDWRIGISGWGKRLVVTNGCFDILHAGHVHYLRQARALGDVLLVGLNSDASVRRLKGENRPVNSEQDRAAVLSELESVDAVYIFPETRATLFLLAARPHVWVKGGDYTLETIDAVERQALRGSDIRFIDLLPGRSTSAILAK